MSVRTDPTDLLDVPWAPTPADRLWTLFGYLPGSGSAGDWAARLRDLPLGFEPTRYRISVLGSDDPQGPFEDAAWDRFGSTTDSLGFDLEQVENEGRDDERVLASLRVSAAPAKVEVLLSGVEPAPALLAVLTDAPGLLGGVRGDQVDAGWQGEQHPPHFECYYGKSWEHLPRTTDDVGREVMDVSGNPGRITDAPGWRFWPAQDDWYGPSARLYVDLDALPSLSVGTVTDLGGDRWHVRLWEDGAALDDVRSAQRALREQLGYDALDEEDKQDEVFAAITEGQPDDPMFLAQERTPADGTFPHGGLTRILQYFSAEKIPTTRSRAAWLTVQEFDADHQQVHDELVDLSQDPHPDLGA